MGMTDQYLAELHGWTCVNSYDFANTYPHNKKGVSMYQWVQDNIPAERWTSWNGKFWFKDCKDATWFRLVWA